MTTNPLRDKLAAAQAKADEIMAARRGFAPGYSMAVTRPADVPDWNPGVVSAAFYDRLAEPNAVLTSLSSVYGELNGAPGDTIRVPTDAVTTPAANLAVDVPAVDDSLTSAAFTFTMKEAVKSIAWYDRTQIQSNQNVNDLAGRKVGTAVEQRIELDLGAALVAGRNVAADATATKVDTALIRAMKRKIPSRLRRRGLVLVGADSQIDLLSDDALVLNASAFGSDEVMRSGAVTRPLFGVSPYTLDDGVLPATTIGGAAGPVVVMFALGMLGYGFQKNPTAEQERDARARLTRWVGTAIHGEGTLEAAGIVATRITG